MLLQTLADFFNSSSFFWLCEFVIPQGHYAVAEARCNWFPLDINIYVLLMELLSPWNQSWQVWPCALSWLWGVWVPQVHALPHMGWLTVAEGRLPLLVLGQGEDRGGDAIDLWGVWKAMHGKTYNSIAKEERRYAFFKDVSTRLTSTTLAMLFGTMIARLASTTSPTSHMRSPRCLLRIKEGGPDPGGVAFSICPFSKCNPCLNEI
jgi:hypothetical protein